MLHHASTYTLLYLIVGLLNMGVGHKKLMFFHGRDNRFEGAFEILFYVLLWPVQLVFWTLVSIHNGIEWLFEKVMG